MKIFGKKKFLYVVECQAILMSMATKLCIIEQFKLQVNLRKIPYQLNRNDVKTYIEKKNIEMKVKAKMTAIKERENMQEH